MLVFWLGVVAGIMAFLIAVKTCDLTGVTFLFFLSGVNGIIASGRGFLRFPSAFLSAFQSLLLVFFLSRLCQVVMWRD